MRQIVVTLVAVALLAASPAHAGLRPRPTDVPPSQASTDIAPNGFQIYNDYATPSLEYAAQRAVVHYVVSGVDAPPLNDDDGDGIPDYVERVGAAADTALAYYGRRGFAPILPDTGGPDSRPDVYLSRFAPGTFGVAFPGGAARGGAFVVVSNALDPSPGRSLGSLNGTVAHELFHLVQFSYFGPAADPSLPAWALEGTAAAMEGRVYPELDDIVTGLQVRPWLAAPQQSLTGQSYAAQLLWRWLDEREPALLPALLARLAAPRAPGTATALASSYARVTGRPFAPAFGRFAEWLEESYGPDVTPLWTLRRHGHASARVAPLALHVVRLSRGARSVSVGVGCGCLRVALTYELESEEAGDPPVHRRVRPRAADGLLVWPVPRGPRVGLPTLVVANGSPTHPGRYSVTLR